MIDTSTELFNAFMEDTRQIMVRIEINGRVFDNDDITSLNLEYGSMDGGSLSLGATVASSLQLTFSELVEGLQELSEIVVEMGAVLPDGTTEYVPMGTFIVNDEIIMDRNNNKTTVEAMDKMIMLGGIYESSLTGDYASIREIALDVANQAGVEVESNFDRLRADSILIPRGKTYRETIGMIAQFEVGFATFSRLGKLEIKRLKNTDFRITPDDYTMKGLVKNEVFFRLNGIQCQVGDNEDDILQSGSSIGNQIVLNNHSMTQTHLNRLFEELRTLNYYPYELDWHGNPALEAGDWIEIEDLEGNLFKSPNLNYTLDFNGGLKAKSRAETTATSEVVYQYKSPLKQQIEWINARISASGGNHIYDDLTEPNNPKEGDLWFKPVGPETELWQFSGGAWVKIISTADTTKVQREVEAAQAAADSAKQEAITGKQEAIEEAERLVVEQSEAFDVKFETETGVIRNEIEQAYINAVTEAKTHTDNQNTIVEGKIAEVENEVADVKDTADKVAGEVNAAISDAGFTSLSDTIQNVGTIATNADQNAQQAISNSSSAHDLAQTSISEAQTAQANSLTALGKADNALVGVSNLDIRVDDVEAEVALKADNTFMNEDGTLTTLSNAITFNANRFSSDMQRIESRVESLAGAVNLVILRDAFEDRRIESNTVYPNVSFVDAGHNTMRELITVTGGERIALSKEATTPITNDTNWRVIFYDSQMGIISRPMTASNEIVLTVPNNATKMWVSWPKGSRPQIIRGSDFLPYRPNMADQMTTDEMVIFRNEYDEYADRTERRLTAIDSEGGSLDALSNEIITTAEQVTTDMTALIDTKVGNQEFTEFYQNEYSETAQEVSRKVSLSDINIGARNIILNSDKPIELFDKGILRYKATSYVRTGQLLPDGTVGSIIEFGSSEANNGWIRFRPFKFEAGKEYTFSFWARRSTAGASLKLGIGINSEGNSSINSKEVDVSTTWQRFSFTATISRDVNVYNFVELRPPRFTWDEFARYYIWRPQLERANVVSDWKEAPEDSDTRINHIQTEWTQTFDTFNQTVSSIDGRVTEQKQTLDGLETTIQSTQSDLSGTMTLLNQTKQTVDSRTSVLAKLRTDVDGKTTISQFNTLSTTVDGTVARVGNAEGKITQIEMNVNGLQSTVADKASQSQVTQLATGLSSVVTNLSELEVGGRNLIKNSDYKNGLPEREMYNASISVLERFDPYGGISPVIRLVPSADNHYFRFQKVIPRNDMIYTFSAWMRRTNGTDYGVSVRIGTERDGETVTVGDTWKKVRVTGKATRGTDAYNFVEIDTNNKWVTIDIFEPMFEFGTMASTHQTAPEDTQSQISQLANNINLRVTKGDVVSQINIEANRTLISSGKILLDGDTYIMGTTFVNDIKAKSLEAVNADISNLRTKILTADVITSTHLKVDNALIDKLTVNTLVVDRFFAKTAVIDNLSVKTLTAITANITSIRSQVLVTDSVTSTHLKSDTALIDKLFATTALIDTLTSKTAFINSVKAVDISADKITTGTLNAANVNIINLNANEISTGTITGANSSWNLNTGVISLRNPSNGDDLHFTQGEINFRNGAQGRTLKYNSGGLLLRPDNNNAGTALNTGFILEGGVTFVQFNNRAGTVQHGRLQMTSDTAVLRIPNGADFLIQDMDGSQSNIRANIFKTVHSTGEVIYMQQNRIYTIRDGNRNIFLEPNGTGSVVAGSGDGTRWNVVASDFVKQSTRESKTDIKPIETKGLDVIGRLNPVSYKKKDKVAQGIIETELGFIAEDSLEVATPDGKGIYDSHITAYLVKGVQEMDLEIKQLKQKIAELERNMA